jgi:radical SAM superfamily enzyme YgiQ (UPF0313 family)
MKVLLISPNTLTKPYPVYPLGLDYVAGSLSSEHPVRIADMNCESLDSLARILQDFSPEVIGLSYRNIDTTEAGDPLMFIREYRKLVDWLRKRSNAVLVCGGSGFTIMPDRVFSTLEVDYGIIGEGERFSLLVDALQDGRDPSRIPGVISSEAGASTPPPWSGKQTRKFQADSSHIHYYLHRGGMLNLQSKRGCSFKCLYCPYPEIEGRKHRCTHPGEVAGHAVNLQEAGARYLFITDSAFNSDIHHSLDVAEAFKTAGLSIPWGGFFAPLRPPAGYFSTLAAAGLRHVEFGTESMSAGMLKTYRKPFSVDDVFAAHRQAREAGLHVAHYLLLGGPGETADTVLECLDHLEKLEKTVLFFFIGIRIYPRTALYDIALDEGKITAATNMLEPVFYEADGIDRRSIRTLVTARAGERGNWIIGSGGETGAATIKKLHDRGFVGPLWELLAR